MDSGIQSPDMADPFISRAWNPESYYNAMAQPLAGSMHAIVPQNYMPVSPQITSTDMAMTRQLENRIITLEQQKFQDGLNSHYRHMQTYQSLQYIQHQMQQLQNAVTYDIPSLRLTISDLQTRLNARENDDCTRQIQLESRTQNQKLESAMKNVNLMRIYAGVSLHDNATFEQVSLQAAEQTEALAKTLRGRVYRGGAPYLLEAEDAEAWAAKLREDIKPAEKHEVDDDLSKTWESCLEDEAADIDDTGKATADAEPAKHVDSTLEKIARSMASKEIESWQALSRQSNATEFSRTRATSSAKEPSLIHSTTNTPEDAASSKDSAHESPHSLKGLPSTVSIKIEESSTSNSSLVQLQVAQPEPVHPLQHAVPTVEIIKTFDIKPDANTETVNGNTINIPDVANASVEAQVPLKKLPPHRKFASARVASKLAEVELDITVKDEISTTGKPKRSKSRKLPPHRRNVSAKIKAPKHQGFGPDVTKQDTTLPSEALKSNEAPANDMKVVTIEPEESDQKVEDKAPSEKQDESITTPHIDMQAYQPTYLKDLPPLSTDQLNPIPSSKEMHGFERTFLTTHLGGTSWFPSFHTIPSSELSLLPNRGYFLLEELTEPLAPLTPGSHGSILTPVLRLPDLEDPTTPNPESMQCAPLFLRRGDKYFYYGMYSYLRSDRWDRERCAVIPGYLKQHWANQLTSPHRPPWVTELLQQHLVPQPTYPRPSSSSSEHAITNAITTYHQTLELWHRDSNLKTCFLRPETLLELFEASDTGVQVPGLRFWCLGLKCEGWDKGFYDMMVREEDFWHKGGKRDGEKEREKHGKMLKMLGKGKAVKW